MAETVPGYEAANWYGLVAPAHTPARVVAKINAEVTRILKTPDVRERLDLFGADVIGGSSRRSREADEVGLCEMGGAVSRGSREKQIITAAAAPPAPSS